MPQVLEQIVKVENIIQWSLRALKWNVYVGRVVEQVIDVQTLQVEKIVKVPRIEQQVEDTLFRHSAVGKNLKTGSSSEPVNKLRTHVSSHP